MATTENNQNFLRKAPEHFCEQICKKGCGTKQPFLKRDKTADSQNGTKQPIFKTGQNSRFLKRDKTADFQKYLA